MISFSNLKSGSKQVRCFGEWYEFTGEHAQDGSALGDGRLINQNSSYSINVTFVFDVLEGICKSARSVLTLRRC